MDTNIKYYNWSKLLGHYPSGYRIFISVGEGGVGKTYGAFKTCKNRLFKNPDRKMLLVRDAENVLDAFNSEDGKNTLEKHFCKEGEIIKMEKDDLWLCDRFTEERETKDGDPYEKEIIIKKRHLGSMAALSTFYKVKGLERAEAGYDTIFIDEFIQESRQADRIDAARAFYRTLQSTLRTKPDAVVLMAANLVNDTPLWNVFECRPGPVGSIVCNPKTGVVIEHVKPSESWVEAHNKSVAGRLGIDDYKRDKRINPNIRQIHREKGVVWTNGFCRKLTNDGGDVVWIFTSYQFKLKENGLIASEEKNTYCCSDTVGQEIYDAMRQRGMRCNAVSRVTTFGYKRQPKSYFDPFSMTVNSIIFESKLVLGKFEKIVK